MLDQAVVEELRSIVGRENVFTHPLELIAYEYDAGIDTATPDAVVLPGSTEQVSRIVCLANEQGLSFTPRGSGTNLSGGTVASRGGIVIGFSRMNKIIEIDLENLRAVVQPGVYNLDLYNVLAKQGYFYAPDPSSQKVSTLGGNVAENSGGPHCLKYGVTTNHVLGLEVVLPDGEIMEIGGKALDTPGYDLTGLFVGSEGTLGIVTEITVRIAKLPEKVQTMLAIFQSLEHAAQAVSDIIGAGMLPATLEMMDNATIEAVETTVHAGYPLDAEAVLIIELDGLSDSMERLAARIVEICQRNHVTEVRVAADANERDRLWVGRKSAFAAIARLKPNYYVCDGVVPRSKLPETLKSVVEIGRKHDLSIANVFHAGDGNLHPLILYDARKGETEKAIQAGMEILEICVRAGGTISGEHGIGVEKRSAMLLAFSETELAVMRSIKQLLDPNDICNSEKIFPVEESVHV